MTHEDVARVVAGDVVDSEGHELRLGDVVLMRRGHSVIPARVVGWARAGEVWVDYRNLSGKLTHAKRNPRELTRDPQGRLFGPELAP